MDDGLKWKDRRDAILQSHRTRSPSKRANGAAHIGAEADIGFEKNAIEKGNAEKGTRYGGDAAMRADREIGRTPPSTEFTITLQSDHRRAGLSRISWQFDNIAAAIPDFARNSQRAVAWLGILKS